MADANRDGNYKATALGISSVDNTTPIRMRVNPSTNYLLVVASSDSITPVAATMDKRDQNFVPTVYGVSSVDGTTLVPVRTDTNGTLLVEFE